MSTTDFLQETDDFKRIEKAIRFLEFNFKSQPSLDEIAGSVHMSKYHFDRVFKRWAGISPIQFLQYITLDYTKQKLAESMSILDTALDAGLSGPSRLHDLFVTFEAMTPGDYKNQAEGVNISYGFGHSPFGECLLAVTNRGICYLGFVDDDNQSEALNKLHETWPGADFAESPESIKPVIGSIFKADSVNKSRPFNLILKGTNFQTKVWRALLSVPEGWVVSYQDIASFIGQPEAYRAVANAVAINPIAYLIPCHRVIAKSGKIHNYRWGSARKKAIVGWEAAKAV